MSAQALIPPAFLALSCVSLGVQVWALAHLIGNGHNLIDTGLLRTSICRVACAVLYVYVGLNALWFTWAELYIPLVVFGVVQATWQANAVADVQLKRKLTGPKGLPMFACDVSYYQPVVNDSYPHQWLIFRGCDGDYVDPNAGANLAWSVRNLGHKLTGFTVYVVYRPGLNGTILRNLDALHVPASAHVMVDCESWQGAISGDHSGDLNALVTALAQRQGSATRVWGYGNTYDLAGIWPHRPGWLGLVVAAYGSQKPTLTPLVGWQYYGVTNDQVAHGYPTSSSPFGPCDHNELYITAPAPPKPTPVPLEDQMAYMVKVNPVDCAAAHVAWPGIFLTDGVTLAHVSTGADVAAFQALGVKYDSSKPISLAQYHALGGK